MSEEKNPDSIAITSNGERGFYRLFSWFSHQSVILTAKDLIDLHAWIEQRHYRIYEEIFPPLPTRSGEKKHG